MTTTAPAQPEPVTALMPVRNAMPYLRQTLASVLAQSYPALRLIVWDNGSTDGTVAELQRWVPTRVPGRVITGKPLPLGRCRAALVELAETELCAWFDADDVYAADRVEAQVNAIQRQPDAALVSGAMRIIDRDGKPTGEVRRGPTGDAETRWALRFSNPIAQPASMFRRSAVLNAGNYPDVPGEEDYEMWLALSLRSRLVCMQQVVMDYRVHDSNITHRFNEQREQHLADRRRRLHHLLLPGFGLDETQRLYESLCPHRLVPVTRDDIDRLERAAQAVARASGIEDEQIRATDLFRSQRLNLRTRLLKQRVGMRQVWPALRLAKRVTLHARTKMQPKGGPAWVSRV